MPRISSREWLWRGPEQDGITYSLLCRFLNCRERFRLLTQEGLIPNDTFNHRLAYGVMWHLCEEACARSSPLERSLWQSDLKEYCVQLCQRYPLDTVQVEKYYETCKVQFPVYVDYWSKHPDVLNRKPLLQEVSFRVPYVLPSGRTVTLRGKWDSVDTILSPVKPTRGLRGEIYLQENKTKGDIDELQLKRQLTFDFQTMIYLVALEQYRQMECAASQADWAWPIGGVRYNVIRRPHSGGKGSIRPHQATKNQRAETPAEYYARLRQYFLDEPEHWFMRWKVEIREGDVTHFRRNCLDPILENLCCWYETLRELGVQEATRLGIHWQHPFGVYSVLDEGGSTDLDAYLATGSTAGLCRAETLFPELTDSST